MGRLLLCRLCPTPCAKPVDQQGFDSDKKVAGFDLPGALLTGVETRTSSPLRILRDDSFQSTDVHGLYPAGEGAGFAGGILTAAIDGIKVAEALANQVLQAPPTVEQGKA